METIVAPHMKQGLANHILVRELDTPKYKAFWLKKPSEGRMMSTRIVFTPEGIALMGDLTPDQRGNVSDLGYGLDWFAGNHSECYLASKFLSQSLQPEKVVDGIREWIKNKEDHGLTDEQVEELTEVADELEGNDIDTGEAYRRISDVKHSLVDDGLPGHDYADGAKGWLCAIQQRFSALYHGPALAFKPDDYLIVSAYWTRGFITFWKPNCSNYADPIEWAGTYTREEASKKFTRCEIDGNTWGHWKDFAVPASALTTKRMERHWVDNERVWMIPASPSNKNQLLIASRKAFPERFALRPLPLPG